MENSECTSPNIEDILVNLERLDSSAELKVLDILQQECKVSQTSTHSSIKKRKRQEFDEDFKKESVEKWKNNRNYSLTASLMNDKYKEKLQSKIDESYVRRWVEEKVTQEELKCNKKKPKQMKPKRRYPELEHKLLCWFKIHRAKKIVVALKMLREQALEVFTHFKQEFESTLNLDKKETLRKYCDTFKASRGWINRFLKHNHISKRAATHIASSLSDTYSDELARFIGRVRQLKVFSFEIIVTKYFRMDIEYYKKQEAKSLLIANMDEVPVYYDMRRNSTYHWKGEKTIQLVRTNGHKRRLTVCLGILSNGQKLPPFIIFKGKTKPNNPFSKHLMVAVNKNGWITESQMLTWVSRET